MSAELENTNNGLPSSLADASRLEPEAASPAKPAETERNQSPEAVESAPQAQASGVETHGQAETLKPGADPEAKATDSGDTEDLSLEAMGELIEQYPTPREEVAAAEHKPIEGRVVSISELGVVVDIGTKREALIPAQEFADDGAVPLPAIGQTVEVERLSEEKDGYTLLSYQRPFRRAIWKKIEEAYRSKAAIQGKIVDLIKGGLVADIGVRAFVPASQIDLRPQPNLESWKGQTITCRVIKMNRKRGNVVVSRRVLLEEESEAKRQQVMASLAEGQRLAGHVKNITDYGVFVDLGGIDGLLHITDLSWGRLKHPSEAVTVGQEIEVEVLRFDREKGRVSLGRKQLLADPWANAPERFPVGTRVQGKVAGVTDYGAFVELDAGVEGLVHISEMSWSKRMKHPSKVVAVGDPVEVVVLDIKPEQRRISLGLKQTTPDPWQEVADKYPIGTVVTGRVRNLTEFGAFVEIEEGFDGLIHVSDISWAGRVKNPSEAFKKGDTVTAKVLKIDQANRRVSLGVKQVNDIWSNWFAAHKMNDLVRGKVSRMATFGAFVELAEGIEGLCHVSEIEEKRRKHEEGQQRPAPKAAAGTTLEAGKEYDFKIVKLDPDQHRIGLSFRAALKQAEKREMDEYRSSKTSSTATIGDAILSKGRSL
jgi:small subunit ribosomal protein S1